MSRAKRKAERTMNRLVAARRLRKSPTQIVHGKIKIHHASRIN